MDGSDTIFALSSGALPSGVAVIRLSGPSVAEATRRLCGSLPAPRRAGLRTLRGDRGILDDALVIHFPGPHSFTGEDCVEIQGHGGRASVDAILKALSAMQGLRPAEAGEFTRRAFLNGRMDFTQAEGLADLIEAETEAQRILALSNNAGRQRELYQGWQDRLTGLRAIIEAGLDFSDTDDIEDDLDPSVWTGAATIAAEIADHLEAARPAEIVRSGYRVVLAGPPNAGKSSLLNALAKRDIAIVSDIAGTTRDRIEVAIDLDGYKLVLTDTAGLRDTDDPIETIGVERARMAMSEADLVVYLEPVDEPSSTPAFDGDIGEDKDVVRVRSKADRGAGEPSTPGTIAISVTGAPGIEPLLRLLRDRLATSVPAADLVAPTRQRHVAALSEAERCLLDAAHRSDDLPELRAEALRRASFALGRLTGQVDAERILDDVFGAFCIGK